MATDHSIPFNRLDNVPVVIFLSVFLFIIKKNVIVIEFCGFTNI